MSNYSFQTSLPPYHSNQDEKQRQADMIYQLIKHGANNLLQLSELTGLEQGRVSARMSDLMAENKTRYDGKIIYKNQLRKKIVAVKPPVKGVQQTIFG